MYTVSSPLTLALQLHQVSSAPLDHQSCGLTGPEAFVFCLPPAPSQSFPLKIQAVFYPKVSTKTDLLRKHPLHFDHLDHPILRISGCLRIDFECKGSQGICQEHCLEVTLSEIPESARRPTETENFQHFQRKMGLPHSSSGLAALATS